MNAKPVSETYVTMAQVVEPQDANFLDKMFGGALLARIDLCAYGTASKFAGTLAVTASFDRVDFHEPIEVGELVTMTGRISFVGRSSMEVIIEVHAENLLKGTKRHTNTARVTMVALKDGKPCEVPRLICESHEDKLRYLEGKLRKERRFVHRAEFDQLVEKLKALAGDALDGLLTAETIQDKLG